VIRVSISRGPNPWN